MAWSHLVKTLQSCSMANDWPLFATTTRQPLNPPASHLQPGDARNTGGVVSLWEVKGVQLALVPGSN